MIAYTLSQAEYIFEVLPRETNMIIFEVEHPFTPQTFVDKLKEFNNLTNAMSPTQLRLVTHLDRNPEMIE